MKHPSSRALFDIWDKSRGTERAPYRSDLTLDALRELLGDIFVVSCDAKSNYPLRVAGTRLCAMFGGDRKNASFPALFVAESRSDLATILSEVADELVVVVAGVSATSASGTAAALELLVLPFRPRAHTPLSLTGLLVPLVPVRSPLHDLRLTSRRYVECANQRFAPRALRKLALARGLMVYEGSRQN